MKYLRFRPSLILLTVTTFGLLSCETKKDNPKPEKEELNECVPYTPETNDDLINADWSAANENDLYPRLLSTNDPAGGYFIVTLKSQTSTPWLDISVPGDAASVINGSVSNTTGREIKFAFSAHPGIQYDVMAKPFHNGTFPEDYTLSWNYVGIMDCYEPNNTYEQAKFVPKNESIEAFANLNNEGYGVNADEMDYYKIVLDEEAKIKVELLQSPSDHFVNLRIYDAGKSHIVSTLTNISGNAQNSEKGSTYSITTNRTLPAGTYYIRQNNFLRSVGKAADLTRGDAIPDSWKTPYKFKVTMIK